MSKLERLMAEVGTNVDESTAGPSGPTRKIIAHQAAPGANPKMIGVDRARNAALIELDRIVPDPDQPRKEFTEGQMTEMAESLRERGQLQPVRVRWDEGLGKYRLIMGERRYRAAIMAGIRSLAAIIDEAPLTPGEILEIQLVENTAREDLKPVELALAIRRLIDEFGYTQETVAARLKMAQSSVSEALSLLKLDPEIRAKVDEGSISTRAARHIARVDSPEAQREVAAEVERGGLTEAETARVVRQASPRKARARKSRGGKPTLPRAWKVRDRESGFTIVVERKKGFLPGDLVEFLRAMARRAEAESSAEGRTEAA
jgi:ParB family transcriptional regulator, chromosome partitioning protein